MSKGTIYIIGAGAIGRALAVFLQRAGKDIFLLRGQIGSGRTATEDISVELGNGELITETITISTLENIGKLVGIIVIATKSYGNAAIADRLETKAMQSPLVIMQNGLDVEMPFIKKQYPEIYRCILFATSQQLDERHLRFKPVAPSPIGLVRGVADTAACLVQQLSNPYLAFKAVDDIQPVTWTKAIVNSVFNSVCPLLETDNGIFTRNEMALDIAKRVIAEGVAIAAARGIMLDEEEVTNSLLRVSQASAGQLISTYQDIIHHRRTEIETLNFAIHAIAGEMQKTDAVKETRLLGELLYIKAMLALT